MTTTADAIERLVTEDLLRARQRHEDLQRQVEDFVDRWQSFLVASGQASDESEEERRRRTLMRRPQRVVNYRAG
jgi:hypothetical protein